MFEYVVVKAETDGMRRRSLQTGDVQRLRQPLNDGVGDDTLPRRITGCRLETVADRYDLDVADVYRALVYYHDHPREMRDVERERAAAMDEIREPIDRPDGVDPASR